MKELEKAGIPTAQISAITPVAAMVGSNRIIKGAKIVSPLCDVNMKIEEEGFLAKSARAVLGSGEGTLILDVGVGDLSVVSL